MRVLGNLKIGTRLAVAFGGMLLMVIVATIGFIGVSQVHAGLKTIYEDCTAVVWWIVGIINVIDGIAFQTSVLALNAAVQAARASEQGRGFAVEAGDVRALAQRSAEAARQIKGQILQRVETVQNGASLVNRAGQTTVEMWTRCSACLSWSPGSARPRMSRCRASARSTMLLTNSTA